MREFSQTELDSISALKRLSRLIDEGCFTEADMRELLSDEGFPRSLFEMYSEDIHIRANVSTSAAEVIGMISDLARYVEIERFGTRPLLRTYVSSCAYLSALFKAVSIEQSYVLFLSAAGKLDNATLLQKGTVNRITIYMRDLALSAIRSGSLYAVLAHNHPGGFAAPSLADLHATKRAHLALKAVGCVLLDHIIVTDTLCISIRRNGKLDDNMWASPRSKDKINSEWFCDIANYDGRFI